ncbi:His-Xaa-Ser system radical SAM maturase HxsC [Acidihalobacter prosperus]|uniref:His-Xaa-Ser system radical SAM maturase HxsC n=1 Tax=Acidihalobacter prosperus TaxID=160660 RepID=UPI0009EE6761|nr:His-Xaa-Ser system radical SAM maturase HxsC [Acidihalobacter prosperus]
MLTLSGKVLSVSEAQHDNSQRRRVYSLTTNDNLPLPLRAQKALIYHHDGSPPPGYEHYIFIGKTPSSWAEASNYTVVPESFDYLGEGDVVALSETGIRSLYRANSRHNSLLLTERCNHYCLMCSQPPKRSDDSWLLDEAFDAIRLMPRSTQTLGITGGEPTLYRDGFLQLIRHIQSYLPNAALHILSNGRAFSDVEFTGRYATIKHQNLMLGIPLYSSDPTRHDYVVQSRGAFDETIRGILNLKQHQQKVELRVVLHKLTSQGLPDLAEFIARNLLFVDQVALMGLEMTGFTLANLNELWIDPVDYQSELRAAVRTLDAYGIPVSIYNHQLCLIPQDLERFSVKSISDWKNEFVSECESCTRMHECGGFFSSGIVNGYSPSIKKF